MTIAEIEPVEVTEEQVDEELLHYHCCHDKAKGVCGTRLEPEEEDGEDEADCVVCIDLMRHALSHKVLFGHAHCPLNINVICPERGGTV